MKLETAKRLHDAASACREAEQFASQLTRERFLQDRGSQLIFWKLVEIIGEALRQAALTDSSLASSLPGLKDAISTRNRIAHGYDSVNFSLLWDIIQDDLPPLHSRLLTLLQNAPPPGEMEQ